MIKWPKPGDEPWPHSKWMRIKDWWARCRSPHITGCMCCGIHWYTMEKHCTGYDVGSGVHVLCLVCWTRLSTTQRLRYYEQLVNIWREQSPGTNYNEKWTKIKLAVLAGG